MRLSIVIPCYNEKTTIKNIVEEVKASPVQDMEIVIVDDCSTDGTTEILEARINIHSMSVYNPPENKNIWIEHGHRYDPMNFHIMMKRKYPPVMVDKSGVERLIECPGTRFMLQFFNAWDKQFPNAKRIKPILLLIRILRGLIMKSPLENIKATLSTIRILDYFRDTAGRPGVGTDEEVLSEFANAIY